MSDDIADDLECVLGLAVAEFSVSRWDLTSDARSPQFVSARHAVWLVLTGRGWNQSEIARRFGRKPSSVSKAVLNVERFRTVDLDFDRSIKAIERGLAEARGSLDVRSEQVIALLDADIAEAERLIRQLTERVRKASDRRRELASLSNGVSSRNGVVCPT